MGRKYKNPPLIEALCEFRFADSEEWDWTLPGLFYREIKERFPNKRQQNVLESQLESQGAQVSHQVRGGIARMQFLNKNKTVMIQIGPGNLVINQLPPYPTWPNFKNLIFEMLQMYRKIAEPSGLERVAVRYINQIEIGDESTPASKYFKYFPTIPHPIPQNPERLVLRTEIPVEKHNGQLILTLATVSNDVANQNLFILDLDFITMLAKKLSFENIEQWVEEAHNQIEIAFESSITEELRTLFEEV